MIRLPDVDLPAATAAGLQSYQDDVDDAPSYIERVQRAKQRFSSRNRKSDPVFSVVRKSIRTLCYGPVRCGYCEDSCADEIEHIRPKDLYPGDVFRWSNYLYACGPCNGPKNNKYKVFTGPGAETLSDITRPHGAQVTPPPNGKDALINPRHENPLMYLQLDLVDTFQFVPIGAADSVEEARGRYTIEVLGLNRDVLCTARRSAFNGFLNGLKLFYTESTGTADLDELARIRTSVVSTPHPTVWEEMKRQRDALPGLHKLFDAVPEALDWRPQA